MGKIELTVNGEKHSGGAGQSFSTWYDHQENFVSACVRINGKYTDWFDIHKGVRQGCVASPWLFNLFLDDCLTALKDSDYGLRMDGSLVKWVGDNEVTSDVMLVDYLRQHLGLHGTKFMCREASCGACIVSVTQPDGTPISVNSCMISVPQCDGWSITTIEKVGNRKDGYHPIQKSMAEHHGTQCGHCTPGWVMAMYSLAQSKKELTKLEIENSFASNICRCTGYRPIMDSLKKFAVDAENSQLTDIEDLYVCKKTNKPCGKSCHNEEDWCLVSNPSVSEEEPIEIELIDGKKWYKVTEIKQVFDILRAEGDDDYMLVGGNTAKGAFPIDEYSRILIHMSNISELKGHSIDQNLTVGAGTTHTEILDIFQSVSKEDNFEYLQKFYDHIELVANIPVRNVATIAGNLMTKHKHNLFPSDMFLLMTTVNSRLTIMDSQGTKEIVSMEEFLNMEMRGKIIYNLLFPPLNPSDHRFSSYKAMPRAQNAHAMVNIGFLCKLSSDSTVENARIVFGGLAPSFVRATKTEEHLKGKALFKNDTLQSTLKILRNEIVVVDDPPEKSPEYRKQLALGLFYKVMLAVCPEDKIGRRYRSAPTNLYKSRPVSKATQDFTTDPELYPLNQPIPKVEAMDQCAGEAKYTNDVPALPYEVFSALVLTTVGQGNIESIDASEALKMPGVIAFYSAKDIPGENSFTLLGVIVFVKKEEVFCSGKVAYYNQPLGIIIATSTALAERAAKRVKVTYANVKKPTIDIKETRKDESRTKLFLPIPNIGRGILVNKKFESNYTIHTQLHFCMELITCLSIPSEQGLEVHASTQWMDSVQYTIAKALNIDMNRVDVFTRRVGGAFGLKISRSSLGSVACSLAAFKLNRPVRLIQSFSSIARALGKRLPCSTDVKVQVSRSGLIQYIDYDLFEDHGHIVSELVAIFGLDSHYNCYKRLWWNFKIYDSTTDTSSNTYCRAPGTLENIAMAETIMEQISYELELDPYDVRMTNLNTILHRDIKEMGEELKKKAEYDRRKKEVEEFNAANRWKKRGLRWAFMKYTPLGSAGFEVSLSVHHGDGSVSIKHAGIEIGQGINTKAIQICAHFLKIPVDKIKVKPQNTITLPNSVLTAGSITSQSIGQGVEKCCLELLLRLAPVRLLLLFPSWEELIRKAHNLKIDLQTRHYVNDIISPIFLVYGVTLSEVEVDILTGECQVRRVDLYEDVGRSVSPQIDVGQVEGAFIMGMSYWMFEDLVYDKNTGEIKSDRPWDYHVAQCKDIPQDFRVSFRENSYSSPVVLGAKVTGEPATCMAISVPLAIRQAIHSALKDSLGSSAPAWFPIEGPHTTEKVCLAAGTEIEQFVFN